MFVKLYFISHRFSVVAVVTKNILEYYIYNSRNSYELSIDTMVKDHYRLLSKHRYKLIPAQLPGDDTSASKITVYTRGEKWN